MMSFQDRGTWNSNIWYMMVVVLTTSGHWMLRLLEAISIYDFCDSWHNNSFKSEKSDSWFIQIYSSASSEYKTWCISKKVLLVPNVQHSITKGQKRSAPNISSFHWHIVDDNQFCNQWKNTKIYPIDISFIFQFFQFPL